MAKTAVVQLKRKEEGTKIACKRQGTPPEPTHRHMQKRGLFPSWTQLCPPKNSRVEVLTPNVTLFGGGPLGGDLG